MNNEVNRDFGQEISEIILIDGYSLMLRYNRIRERVNDKLRKLNLDGANAQVIVDELDKLQLLVSSDKLDSQKSIQINEGIDNDEVVRSDEKSKKDKFVDNINKVIISVNKMSMKMEQINSKATIVASNEQQEIAHELAKVIVLCASDIVLPLKKCGVLNLSEACRKITGGAIDNVVVEDSSFTIINNNGLSQTFNSVGHSEEDVISTISNCIILMIDFHRSVRPLVELSEVPEPANETRVQPVAETKKLENVYNKEVEEALGSIDKELDNLAKRAWSQRVRGLFLKCAHRSGFELLAKAGIESHYEHMTDDNKKHVHDLYIMYNQTIPMWMKKTSTQKGHS